MWWRMTDWLMERAFLPCMALFLAFIVVGSCVYLPASVIAESECLKKGYPKAKVDYKLDAYCINLEGVVTGKVEELK